MVHDLTMVLQRRPRRCESTIRGKQNPVNGVGRRVRGCVAYILVAALELPNGGPVLDVQAAILTDSQRCTITLCTCLPRSRFGIACVRTGAAEEAEHLCSLSYGVGGRVLSLSLWPGPVLDVTLYRYLLAGVDDATAGRVRSIASALKRATGHSRRRPIDYYPARRRCPVDRTEWRRGHTGRRGPRHAARTGEPLRRQLIARSCPTMR